MSKTVDLKQNSLLNYDSLRCKKEISLMTTTKNIKCEYTLQIFLFSNSLIKEENNKVKGKL